MQIPLASDLSINFSITCAKLGEGNRLANICEAMLFVQRIPFMLFRFPERDKEAAVGLTARRSDSVESDRSA